MASNQAFREKIDFIKAHYSCLSYANQELGWPVNKDGDRHISLAPGSENPTALIIHEQYWYDFKTGDGGDVIDLCARVKYNGNKGDAIWELGRDFQGSDFDFSKWKDKITELCNKIQFWHESLRPVDIEYLHSRRISDETIERLKLGYDEKTERLIIPYFKNNYVLYYAGRDRKPVPPKFIDGEGNEVGPFWESVFEKEKPADRPADLQDNPAYIAYVKEKRSKYQKAFLDGFTENIPWGMQTLGEEFREKYNKSLCERLPGADKILCILEGAFDVMSFEQEGFICLSPIGGYFQKKINQFVIDIAKSYDKVFICFDSDGPGSNFNLAMAKMMFEHRIPFMIGRLPKDIKDVSDYYVGGGDLVKLVQNAEEGMAALLTSIKDMREFKSYVYKAARYIDKADLKAAFNIVKEQGNFDSEWLHIIFAECTKPPAEKIIVDEVCKKYIIKYVEAVGFFIYDKQGYWKSYSDNAIKSIIADLLGIYANGGKLTTILSYLKAQTTTQEFFNRQEVVNFQNGVLDLKSGEMLPHSPEFMQSYILPYKYNPESECKKWDRFVSEIMDFDPLKIMLLHEAFGYVLFADCSLQKCFVFYGEGGNGKSVCLNVAGAVFGEDNCCNVQMSLLASPFDPIRLMNKWANFMTETDTNIKDAEARFKSLVAGEKISASYKGKDAIEFSSRAKHFMACNKYLNTNDTSRGMYRRLIFMGFNHTFEGREANKNLTSELMDELSGIFNRFYDAYKRLKVNMEFTITPENEELLNDFIQIIDPVEAFIEDEATGFDGTWPSNTIYEKYVEWCKATGHAVQSRQRFTRSFKINLKRRFPSVIIMRDSKGYMFDFTDKDIPF